MSDVRQKLLRALQSADPNQRGSMDEIKADAILAAFPSLTSPVDRDAAVELMAEAGFSNYFGSVAWASASEPEQDTWRVEAEAMLEALIAAGWGPRPVNPESADG